ncbi:MAG TPA: MFS transporter [Candidatus Eisenbacteria bacterium]|nr:MFS transporter [Candidatus Eisenbacteria bacterium]
MRSWFDVIFPRKALVEGDRRLLHLFVGRMLGSVGFSITVPFLAIYLHGERHVAMSAIGGMFFIAALAGAAAQIIGGEWADRQGRKIVMVVAQVGRSFIFAGMGVAALTHAEFVVFVALTCGSAFFGRLFEPPSGAMISDVTEGSERAEAFGILRVAGNFGFALGPAIGGFLAALSYAALFFLSAAIILASGIIMSIVVRESLPPERRRGAESGIGDDLPPGLAKAPGAAKPRAGIDLRSVLDTLRDGRFLRHCLSCLILFTVLGQLMSTFSVYVVEWCGLSKPELGWIYSVNGALVVLIQFPIVKFLAPYRMTTALIVGSVLFAVGYGMMGLVGTFGTLALAMTVVTLGEVMAVPATMNLTANFATEETRGRYMGVYGLFNSFGWSLGPLVGGALLDASNRVAWIPWSVISLLCLFAALGFWDLRGRLSRAMDRDGEPAVAARVATVT